MAARAWHFYARAPRSRSTSSDRAGLWQAAHLHGQDAVFSFSDDPTKLGAPKGFTVTVRNVQVSAGAGFLVALTGDIMTMPGLPKVPAAERIDVDENGKISGLF